MPYEIRRHGSGYSVVNKDTRKVHSKHATKESARAQFRLLEGIEHGTIKKARAKKSKNPRESSSYGGG